MSGGALDTIWRWKAPTKPMISLCVSRDVLGRFRATGEGWQTRMDEALREWIDRREAKGG